MREFVFLNAAWMEPEPQLLLQIRVEQKAAPASLFSQEDIYWKLSATFFSK